MREWAVGQRNIFVHLNICLRNRKYYTTTDCEYTYMRWKGWWMVKIDAGGNDGI